MLFFNVIGAEPSKGDVGVWAGLWGVFLISPGFWIPNCLSLSWGIPLNTVQVWKKTLPIPGLFAWKSQAGSSVQQRVSSLTKCSRSDTGGERALENAHGALGTSASRKKQEAVERLGTTWTGEERSCRHRRSFCCSFTGAAHQPPIKDEQLVRGNISALVADFPAFSWSALCVLVCFVGL